MRKKPNLYRLLQVDPGADIDIIRLAHKYLVNKYKAGSGTSDPEMLRLVTDAWRILGDETTRADYDDRLLGGVEITNPQVKALRPTDASRWTSDELRVAILKQLLLDKNKGIEGGIFDSQLTEILSVDMFTLKSALTWLQRHEFIDNVASRSRISATGIAHLNACVTSNTISQRLPGLED